MAALLPVLSAPVTTFYGGLLGVLGIILSLRAVMYRRKSKVYYGTGDNKLMEALSRGHGNYAEYAPIGVILSGLAELSGRAPAALVHAFGAAMLLGRMGYGYAASVPIDEMSRNRDRVYSRIWGMCLTYASIAGSSAVCIGLPAVAAWAAMGLCVVMAVVTGPSGRPAKENSDT